MFRKKKSAGDVVGEIALMMQQNYYKSERKLGDLALLCFEISDHLPEHMRIDFKNEVLRLSGTGIIRTGSRVQKDT